MASSQAPEPEEAAEEVVALRSDYPNGLIKRLAVAGPATGVAALVLILTPYLPSPLGACGLLLLLGALAARVARHGYAADRTACLLVAYVAVLWILRGAVTTGVGVSWAVFATLSASAALIAMQPVRQISAVEVPIVGNLPGVEAAPEPAIWDRLSEPVALLGVAAGIITCALGVPIWVWTLIAVAVATPPALSLERALRRIGSARMIEKRLDAALAGYAPEYFVYTATSVDSSYQVKMWLPYLERTGRRFVIVAASNTAARGLLAVTSMPVITRTSLTDLDRLIVPSLRAVFYVNASSRNGAMVRHRQLTHVYLGHGDSDKPPSFNPTHAMYDKIFCAGQAAIDRYTVHGVDIPVAKFETVGRPQVEQIVPTPGKFGVNTVLYAPTWLEHGSDRSLSSLPRGEQIVRALLAHGHAVIFRPHQLSLRLASDTNHVKRIDAILTADAAASGRAHLTSKAASIERSLAECINASDALVSDVSGVASDYLASGKPFALVAPLWPTLQFIREFPLAAYAYCVDPDLRNLDEAIERLSDDPHAEQRRAVRDLYLGNADGTADAFIAACLRVLDAPHPAESGLDDSVDEAANRAAGRPASARAHVRRHGRGVAIAGVATLAAVLGLLDVFMAAGALGIAASLAIGLATRRAFRDRVKLNRLVGTYVVPRVVVLIALTATAVADAPPMPDAIAPALSLAALVATTMAEFSLRRTWVGPGSGVRFLPGVVEPRTPHTPPGVAFAASVASITMASLFVALPVPTWLLSVPATTNLLVAGYVVRMTIERSRALDRARKAMPQALAEYAPQFAVYFGSRVGARYQVGMWLPYFHRIGRPFVIVTRTHGSLDAISKLDPTVPIIYRPSARSLDDVIVPTLNTVFYVNNAVRNTHMIEHRELTHIWLNHGDSEKPACFNPVHAIYDRIYAAGQAAVDRYERHGVAIAQSKFEIVGRPQVERIRSARGPIQALTGVTVLYAPTWRGPYADSRLYSLPAGERLVMRLLDRHVRIVFRAHPFNYRYSSDRKTIQRIGQLLDTDRRISGREHLWGRAAEADLTVEDCFNLSDAMIADVSAVVSDYLQSGKPFSIVSVGRGRAGMLSDVPAARAAYLLRDDLADLDMMLDNLLGADPLAAEREATRAYYLGDLATSSQADGFLASARRAVDAPRQLGFRVT